MWGFKNSVSKCLCNGNCMSNYSSSCYHAGELAMWRQFPSWAAGRHGLLHDLGVSLATCCPFTKVDCASQQEPALTSLGRSKQSSEGQWSSLAEQSGLEHVKCLWVGQEPQASHSASTAPACWHCQHLHLVLPLPWPDTPGTAACCCREPGLKSLF